MDTTLLQLLLVLLTAPAWYPVVQSVVREVWATSALTAGRPGSPPPATRSELESTPSAARAGRARRAVWSDDGPVWSKRRLVNPRWDTGHRLLAPARSARLSGGFPHRRPSRHGPEGPARRWEGGFGRRGL